MTGIVALGLVADRRGGFDAATVGAVAAVLPDLEQVIPGLRLRGRKMFHRRTGGDRHDSTGLSAPAQMLLAAMILAALLRRKPGLSGGAG